ncbi:hypothetical protein GCM10017708_13210 [Arthrobacter citreus]
MGRHKLQDTLRRKLAAEGQDFDGAPLVRGEAAQHSLHPFRQFSRVDQRTGPCPVTPTVNKRTGANVVTAEQGGQEWISLAVPPQHELGEAAQRVPGTHSQQLSGTCQIQRGQINALEQAVRP